jgi:hypothetical protein
MNSTLNTLESSKGENKINCKYIYNPIISLLTWISESKKESLTNF